MLTALLERQKHQMVLDAPRHLVEGDLAGEVADYYSDPIIGFELVERTKRASEQVALYNNEAGERSAVHGLLPHFAHYTYDFN